MLELLGTVLAIGTTVPWLVAVISGIRMMRHAKPGVSTSYLLTHGFAFFTGDKFTPEAAPHLRRLRIAALVFFVLIVIGGITMALTHVQ